MAFHIKACRLFCENNVAHKILTLRNWSVTMKRLNLKSIKMKILLGFSLVILLMVLFTAYIYISISKSNEQARIIAQEELPILIANEQMARTMANRISTARGYVLYGGDYKDRFNAYTEEGKRHEATVREIGASEEFDSLIKRTVAWRQYVAAEVFDVYDSGNAELARENLAKSDAEVREIMAGYEDLALKSQETIIQTEKEVVETGERTLFTAAIVSALVILVSIAAALITSTLISRPIIKVMDQMKLVAKGDLSQEPLHTNLKDEVGQLIHATNEGMDNTRNLLRKINGVSETITSQSEELAQSASEVKAGSEQIAVTMQEMARGAETLADSSSTLASTMENFTSKMQEANSKGEQIYDTSNNVQKMTEEGSQLMELSVQQMATIDKIVQESVEKVKGLDSQSQDISKLVSVINDIADQTNLLALNAAIEAARAGEHGRGFAVVADEVRKLAEQVSVSVSDITEIVASIQRESTNVVQSLQLGYEEVAKGATQVKTTGDTFAEIDRAIGEMVSNIQIITSNLATMSNDSQEISATIQEIASISEESAAGVEQTSASTQQTSSIMEEIAKSSKDLSIVSEELNELVGSFKL